MSKKINVNPGHYKVAGRERQGEDILAGAGKRAFSESRKTQGGGMRGGRGPGKTAPPARKTPKKKK